MGINECSTYKEKYNPRFSSINEAFLTNTNENSSENHLYFRTNDDQELVYKFSDILRRSTAFAHLIKEKGLKPEDRVLIILGTCPEFIFSFYGTLLAGGIPVPTAQPLLGFRDMQNYTDRLNYMLEHCQPRFLISRQIDFPLFRQKLKRYAAQCHLLDVSEHNLDKEKVIDYFLPSCDDICLIQYTSGTTGAPKAVPVTNRGIMTNLEAMKEAVKVADVSRGTTVTWLPLYHDMGLIGALLSTMYNNNAKLVLFSPEAFVFKPLKWLKYITHYEGRVSNATNFAYRLCLRRIKDQDLEGLDLSSWEVSVNGAEPIDIEVMEQFIEKFKQVGFRKTTMMPGYGIAEATMGVTVSSPDVGPKTLAFDRESLYHKKRARISTDHDNKAVNLVSVGRCIPVVNVKILDTKKRELQEGCIGDIYIKGVSVINSYFKDDGSSKDSFHDGWFKTGDVGFLYNGELFLTGREKEMIIVRGVNYSPIDIENVAKSVRGVDRECVAFSYLDPGRVIERFGIVFETNEEDSNVVELTREGIKEEILIQLGIRPDWIISTPLRTIPKTLNGKIRRNICKDLFLKKIDL